MADWYLEVSKFEKTKSKKEMMSYVLSNILKLWHPFIPFVTEVIWQEIDSGSQLMVEKWPSFATVPAGRQEATEGKPSQDFELIKEIIIAIRNARAENKVEPGKKIQAVIYGGEQSDLIKSQSELIKSLRTGISKIEIKEKGDKPRDAIFASLGKIEIYLLGAVDKEKERTRLEREIENLKEVIGKTEIKLENKEFTDKAPKQIVEKEEQKLKTFIEELKNLKNQLESFS